MNNRHTWLFYCLLALLIWLPWPLGGNRPWAWPVMCFIAFSLLSLWTLCWLRQPYQLPLAVEKAKIPLLLMACWLVYLLIQIIPIPASSLMLISPSSAEAYNGLEATAVYSSISVDRAATFSAIIKSSAYVTLFCLVLVLVDDRHRLNKLVIIIILTAIAQCIYGMISNGTDMVYFKAAHDSISGSYPNRNHFAGFMAMAISLGVGLIMGHVFKESFRSSKKRKRLKVQHVRSGPFCLTLVAIVFMLTGLMLSESRGGFLAFTISFIIMFGFVLRTKGFKLNRSNMTVIFLVLLVFGVIALNSTELLLRFAGGGISGREFVWAPGILMAKDYAIFGSGLGTFQSAFPFYYPAHSQTWWHAHMNYLQLFIEQGIIGFILFASSTVATFVIVFSSFLKRRDGFYLGIMFGVLMGTTSVLIHEMVDYHFFIPANAGYFYVLLAIGIVAASLVHIPVVLNTNRNFEQRPRG